MASLTVKRVLLAVSGSIAAYKVADLVSLLKKQGVQVRIILTAQATHFVSPLVLETLTGFPVRSSLFGADVSGTEHIEYARWPDLLVFVPATANLIAKLNLGLADELVTTVALASLAPRLIAPAMNTVMWENPVVQNHVQALSSRGVDWVLPESGMLACGEEGIGKLATPERIVQKILVLLNQKNNAPSTLRGKSLLITAGPTLSRIDAVRYLTNPSTGRMGAALAEEALARGSRVYYILGIDKGVVRPIAPVGRENLLQITEVETAEEMLTASLKVLPRVEGVIATAAVLDYQVKEACSHKLKRSHRLSILKLTPSVDVLHMLMKYSKKRQWFFGFAAETAKAASLKTKGLLKFNNKNLDYLFANSIACTGMTIKTGFGVDTNAGILFGKKKKPISFPVSTKAKLAKLLLDALEEDFK
jgi:phosphopantothenoylcysteine decarboxylase / phosphopantothenate---cysteine ligase